MGNKPTDPILTIEFKVNIPDNYSPTVHGDYTQPRPELPCMLNGVPVSDEEFAKHVKGFTPRKPRYIKPNYVSDGRAIASMTTMQIAEMDELEIEYQFVNAADMVDVIDIITDYIGALTPNWDNPGLDSIRPRLEMIRGFGEKLRRRFENDKYRWNSNHGIKEKKSLTDLIKLMG